MGMYTELVIKAHVKKDLPDDVRAVLEYLFGNKEDIPKNLPDHPFFTKTRWEAIGNCSSYYHIPSTLNYFKEGYLFSRSDLKNYGNEIDSFLDWIDPYLDNHPGKCIGWHWYEEWHEPTLIYKKDKYEGGD